MNETETTSAPAPVRGFFAASLETGLARVDHIPTMRKDFNDLLNEFGHVVQERLGLQLDAQTHDGSVIVRARHQVALITTLFTLMTGPAVYPVTMLAHGANLVAHSRADLVQHLRWYLEQPRTGQILMELAGR